MDKNSIRANMNELRKSLTEEQIQEYSNKITENLCGLPQFQQSQVIYCFVSFREEVITDQVIETALRLGKQVAVPKVQGDVIEFYYIQGREDLKPGCMGIMEPASTNIPARDSSVFMVMPGLAFDHAYNRIGYGGGYYDRYLDEHKETRYFKAAIAFDFQVVDHLDTMEYDKKVDCIVTPTVVL